MPRFLGLGGSRLRALAPRRLRAFCASAAGEAAPLPPAVFADMEVLIDTLSGGLFSDTAGTTPQVTLGQQVKAAANHGTLGGVLSSTGFTGTTGPLLAEDSGIPILDCRPAGTERLLGCDVASGATGNLTIYSLFKCVLASGWENGGFPWTLAGDTNGTLAFPLFAANMTLDCTLGDGTENMGLSGNVNPFIDEAWHLSVFRRTTTGGSNGTWDAWVDGAKTDTANVSGAATIGRMNLGGGAGGKGFNGYYAFHAMARSEAHDEATIEDVVAYLRQRFEPLLPRRKVCVWVGDSKSSLQTCAVSNSNGAFAPAKFHLGIVARGLQANGLDALYSNAWPGKQTSHHRTSTELDRIEAWLSQASEAELVGIYSGVNDGYFGGLTSAQAFAQITGLIADIRARRPATVFLVEPPGDGDPAVWGGGYAAFRDGLGDLIEDAGNQATYGYTAGTIRSDPVGYAWGTPGRDSAYYPTSDGLHCVGPGMEREGAVFLVDLGALL